MRHSSCRQSRKQSSLTRLAGMFLVKDPKENLPGLTWTALDVGGLCVERWDEYMRTHLPCQGRELEVLWC